MRLGLFAAAAAVLLTAAAPAPAQVIRIFSIAANGAQEVNAGGVPVGDTDGFANGTITLNSGTGGTTGSATLNLTIGNIDGALAAHHIHQAPATTTGGIVLDFGNPNTILTGTSTAGTLFGTITGLSTTTINNVFAGPTGFYYNLHSTPNFPGGAVRHQLTTAIPEPGSLALVGTAVAGALAWRRRRAARTDVRLTPDPAPAGR